jgi:hypothetical protein
MAGVREHERARWEQMSVSAVADRTDFIEVFQAELLRFLSFELNMERWKTREDDYYKYLTQLLTNYFFGKHMTI